MIDGYYLGFLAFGDDNKIQRMQTRLDSADLSLGNSDCVCVCV